MNITTIRHLDGSSTPQLAALYGFTFAKRDTAADARDTAERGTAAWERAAAAVHVFDSDLRDYARLLRERGVRCCDFCPCVGGDHLADCPDAYELPASHYIDHADVA